jgi:hypothetical protein
MGRGLMGGGTGYVYLQYLNRTWGSTREERERVLPGDEIVERPGFVTNHVVTIEAPPDLAHG